jgi:serine/threonine protein kinase
VAHPLYIPARNETWFLLERLGRGGEAQTFRARRVSRLLTDDVCVKIPWWTLSELERRGVLEEARVHSLVRHANVVSLLDVVEDDAGRLVIVLEWVRGSDLRSLQSRSPMEPSIAASVARSLCLALASAQRAVFGGVVHRDVTPHNVLVSSEGEVKLADFGIARALSREPWTRSGHVKGKCAYIAPELVRGELPDTRSDMFSLGVLLYELLSGQRPFGGQSFLSQLDAVVSGVHVPLAERAPDTPKPLSSLVEELLSPERSGRPGPDLAARRLHPFADAQRTVETLGAWARVARGPGLRRVELAQIEDEGRAARRAKSVERAKER